MSQHLKHFRWTALAEGVSYLVLLGIAMPLKYVWAMPMAVKIVGWLHGVLFIAYCALGLRAALRERWTFTFSTWAFVASLIPFGTFVLEWQLKNAEASQGSVADG